MKDEGVLCVRTGGSTSGPKETWLFENNDKGESWITFAFFKRCLEFCRFWEKVGLAFAFQEEQGPF